MIAGAEPAGPGPAREPSLLVAFAELRARLLLRRLRGRGGIPELVARIALFVVAVPAGLVFAALSGAGAWRAVKAGVGLQAEIAVAALFFGIWQTWTAVALSVSDREAIDLRRFLGYPIPPSRVFGYGLDASVIGDPFAVFWCLVIGGAFVGATLARPGAWVLLLAAANLLFIVATTAYVALLQELLARLLRGRRARELAIAAVYIGTALLVASMSGGPRAALRAFRFFAWARWIALPAALAERAVTRLYAQRWAPALGWLALLALAAAVIAIVAYRLALAAALSGGDQGPRAAATGEGGWRLPGRRGALLEKEGKYVLRHPIASVLVLVLPALAGFVGWKLTPRIPQEAGEVVRALPLFGFTLYAHLATQVFWLNAFGWERGGGRVWFLAPIDPVEVLVAKNVATYAFSFALFLASAGTGIALGGVPPAWALLGALALHAGAGPWFLAAGNVVSILNPRPAPYTVQRGGALTPVSAFAGMAIFSSVGLLFSVPALVAIRLDEPWILPGGWAALGAAGLVAYRATLPRVARLLRERREPLLDAISGDDA